MQEILVENEPTRWKIRDVEFDLWSSCLRRDHEQRPLGRNERELLFFLIRKFNSKYEDQDIIKSVWNNGSTESLRKSIEKLRAAFGRNKEDYIVGKPYRLLHKPICAIDQHSEHSNLNFLRLIEDVLGCGRDLSPCCFRENLKRFWIDFMPGSSESEDNGAGRTFVPSEWFDILTELETTDSSAPVWLIGDSATGKTEFGLWLGYSWRCLRPNSHVLYLDAREASDRSKLRHDFDKVRTDSANLLLIIDNLHAWAGRAEDMLEGLPANGRVVFLSQPNPNVQLLHATHQHRYHRILEPRVDRDVYMSGVIRTHIKQREPALLQHPRWQKLEAQVQELCGRDLIRIYYALEGLIVKERINYDLAVNGLLELHRNLKWDDSCPSQEYAEVALMVAAALYQFEIPTPENFLLDHYSVPQNVLNWLTKQKDGWLQREEISKHISVRFPHQSSAKVFLELCDRHPEEMLPRVFTQIRGTSPDWKASVLLACIDKCGLDVRDLLQREIPRNILPLFEDCIRCLQAADTPKDELLLQMLVLTASAARRCGDLACAQKYVQQALSRLKSRLHLGPIRRGWLLYELGMVKYYRNDKAALQVLVDSESCDRKVGFLPGAFASRAQYWVSFARLTPSPKRLKEARSKLKAISSELQQLAADAASPYTGEQLAIASLWRVNCIANIAEMSVDLADDADVPGLLRDAKDSFRRDKDRAGLYTVAFIEGKYCLRHKLWKDAARLLEEAHAGYGKLQRHERITELWIALGDSCIQYDSGMARQWYERAANHSGDYANSWGKRLAVSRLKKLAESSKSTTSSGRKQMILNNGSL